MRLPKPRSRYLASSVSRSTERFPRSQATYIQHSIWHTPDKLPFRNAKVLFSRSVLYSLAMYSYTPPRCLLGNLLLRALTTASVTYSVAAIMMSSTRKIIIANTSPETISRNTKTICHALLETTLHEYVRQMLISTTQFQTVKDLVEQHCYADTGPQPGGRRK